MKKNWRKILSVMLALIMVVTLIPFVGMVKPVEVEAVAQGGYFIEVDAISGTFGENQSANVQVQFRDAQGAPIGNLVTVSSTSALVQNHIEDNVPANASTVLVTLQDADKGVDSISIMIAGQQLISENATDRAAQINNLKAGVSYNITNTQTLEIAVRFGTASQGGGSNPPAQQNYTVDFGAGTWTVGGTNVTATIAGTAVSGQVEVASNAVINFSNINRETMDIYCESQNDGYNMVLAIDDSGNASLGNSFPNGKVIALVVEPRGTHQAGGGGQPGPSGPETLIKIAGPATTGSWTVPEGERRVFDAWKYQEESHS
jgi:hypothetical protein